MHLVLFFADDQAQTALGVLADHDLCVCSAGLERSVAGPAGSAEGIMGTGDLVQRQHAVLFAVRALHVRNLLVHHRLVQRTCAGRHHGFEFPGVGCPAAPGSPAAAAAQVGFHTDPSLVPRYPSDPPVPGRVQFGRFVLIFDPDPNTKY